MCTEIVFDVSTQKNISINRNTSNQITISQNNEQKANWLIHTVNLVVPAELKTALQDERNMPEKLVNTDSIELVLGAKIGHEGIEKLSTEEKLLYSYLPTEERKYSLPVLVNTSFLTTANRELLHSDSKWNQWIFKNIAIEIFKWISQLVDSEYQYQAYNLIPNQTSVRDELGNEFNNGVSDAIKTIPFIAAKDDTLVTVDDAIVDFTSLSEKSFIGETPIKQFIDKYETTSVVSSKKFVKNTGFGTVFKKLNASSFEWRDLQKFLTNASFTSSHTIQLNIELIKHLKYLCEFENVKDVTPEFLRTTPFIWDHKNFINYPPNVCFPTPDDQNWNSPTSELSFLHLELQNWLQQDVSTRSWLESLGVVEKTDITYITQNILPYIESYVTPINAVKTIQDLFTLYCKGDLKEDLIKQLEKIKLITQCSSLKPAYECYLSNSYAPSLKIEGLMTLDIFISDHYLTSKADVDELKRFFKMLGVRDGITLISHVSKYQKKQFIDTGYYPAYFEDDDKRFCPFQTTFLAESYANIVTLDYFQITMQNYEFSHVFWEYVIGNHSCNDISIPAKAYWGHSDMPGQTTGNDVKNILPWFIENVPCIPILSKKCEKSISVFLNTNDIKNIAGKYLPVFDGPELSSDWKAFFKFRTALQLSDYLELLHKISEDTNDNGHVKEDNIERINAIYTFLLDQCQNWGTSELGLVSEWTLTGKLLNSKYDFVECKTLSYFVDGNESIFQDQIQFVYINAENRNHYNLEFVLECFNVTILKQCDFKIDTTESDVCSELKERLYSVCPYFKNWVTHEYSDEKTLVKVSKLDRKLSELQITHALEVQIRYEGHEFVRSVNLHFDDKHLYVTNPWNSNSVLLKLSEVICRYLRLAGHDKKLDFLLRAPLREIHNYFLQEGISIPSNLPERPTETVSESAAHSQITGLNFKSFSELDSAITDGRISPEFFHSSISEYERLKIAEQLVARAVTNVSTHLQKLHEYDCSNQHQLAPSIIGGITKNGNEIVVVARPSDNDEVLLYYFSEFDVLDHVDSEFWCEDGLTPPQKVSLGHILKKTGINRIPLNKVTLLETDFENLLTVSKSESLDFHAVPYVPQKIARIISSFANTNGGLLIFGIKENGPSSNEIVGLSSDFRVDEIAGNAISLLSPIPEVTYNWVKSGDNSIFVIKIEKSVADIMFGNQKYIRNGSISEPTLNNSIQTRILNTSTFERTIAIIIGIENYTPKNGISSVKYAENDVRVFKQLLCQSMGVLEENIHEFVNDNACKSSLEYNLKTLFYSLTEEDRLIFYYVGHGFHNGIMNFLSTYDLHRVNISETAVSLQKILLDPLKKSKCKHALILIDACAQSFQDENERNHITGINDEDFMEVTSEFPYYATFLSCQTGQSSYSSDVLQNGIWTHHLVQAMRGVIPETIRDGNYITDRLLSDYLSTEVAKYVRDELQKEQNPKSVLDSTYENVIVKYN
ncbi:MAG TPA: transcriptional regulator [Spirochaetia bacterium]|nr:transcriptional regulator [Spirochaetia bacterium]